MVMSTTGMSNASMIRDATSYSAHLQIWIRLLPQNDFGLHIQVMIFSVMTLLHDGEHAFQVPICYLDGHFKNLSLHKMDMLCKGLNYSWSFKHVWLPKVGFIPDTDEDLMFGFIDPFSVIWPAIWSQCALGAHSSFNETWSFTWMITWRDRWLGLVLCKLPSHL